MRTIQFLVFIFLSAPALASPPTYVSLKAPFERFVAQAKGKDLNSQIEIWRHEVESALPDVYKKIMSQDGSKTPEQYRREKAAKWFPFLLENAEKISKQFDTFDTSGWPMAKRLAANYPTVDFSDVRVIAMPSLMTFNGQVSSVNGRLVATFGMDTLELIEKDPALMEGSLLINDTAALVAHEFTHALHFKLTNFGEQDDSRDSFFSALWKEGLAQMHSQLLVPGTDLTTVLFDRNLAARCVSSQARAWAVEYLEDSHAPTDKALEDNYNKWFLMNSWKILGVPRAGYCLGYHVVLQAMRDHSFNDLIKMSRAEAYPLVKRVIKQIAQPEN